jgi:hypothetical protein
LKLDRASYLCDVNWRRAEILGDSRLFQSIHGPEQPRGEGEQQHTSPQMGYSARRDIPNRDSVRSDSSLVSASLWPSPWRFGIRRTSAEPRCTTHYRNTHDCYAPRKTVSRRLLARIVRLRENTASTFKDAQVVNALLCDAFERTGLKPRRKWVGSHLLRQSWPWICSVRVRRWTRSATCSGTARG